VYEGCYSFKQKTANNEVTRQLQAFFII